MFILFTMLFGIIDPIVIVIALVVALTRTRHYATIGLVAAALAYGVTTYAVESGGYRPYSLAGDLATGRGLSVIAWGGLALLIGQAVRNARAQKAAPGDAVLAELRANEPASLPDTVNSGVARQLILVRRGLTAGQKLRHRMSADATVAAIDHNLDVLKQAKAQLDSTGQAYTGESAQRLQGVVEEFEQLLSQHGGSA